MHFSNAALLALASSVVAASPNSKRAWGTPSNSNAAASGGKTHMVQVGQGGLKFTPQSLSANPGDKVMFMFWPEAHSVVQGNVDKPCQPEGDNAFFSGLVPTKSGMSSTEYMITIQDQEPVWIYCSAETHCQSGMAMVINPPDTNGAALKTYLKGATKTKTSGTPGGATKWQAGSFNGMLMTKGMDMGGSSSGGNSTGGGNGGNGAGHVAASSGVVGAVAGFMAWALL